MLAASFDFPERIAALLNLSPDLVHRFLLGVLCGGLLCASIHLVTMLITRWGDRAPTSQALLFSLLVHISCGFGLVAIAPAELDLSQKQEEPIVVQKILLEGDESIALDQTGNTPIWEQPPELPMRALARSERPALEFEPLHVTRKRPEPVTPPDIEIPDAVTVPETPVARPQPHQQADPGIPLEVSIPLKIDDPTVETRPEVRVPSLSKIRRDLKWNGMLAESVERQPNRGAVDRVLPELNSPRRVEALDAALDPTGFLKRDITSDRVTRRRGPAPPLLADKSLGTTADAQTSDTAAGSPTPPHFTRRHTRTPRSHEVGGLERLRPERTPHAPIAELEPPVAFREGLDSTLPMEGLKPNVVRPNFETLPSRNSSKIPATYRLRNLARRQAVARKYGGTDASERAVEASLRWLILHQNAEGYWDADNFSALCPSNDRCTGYAGRVAIDDEGVDRQHAGLQADTGLTALAVLAFLGAGYTHEEGQYADAIDRALLWLMRKQQPDGSLAGNATRYARMYCHGMATYALAEAYGMQSDPTTDTRLRAPLSRAVAYIVRMQNSRDGGWRYIKGQHSDMSMFGWQLMALKSAEIAGIPIPDQAKQRMIQFLKDRSLGEHQGLATYRLLDPALPPTPAMTAEALFCKQMLGMNRSNPASIEAVQFVLNHLPKRSEQNLYFWYYGTLAIYQYGGEPWRQWNEALRTLLVKNQRKTGHAAGSWNPQSPWGPYGGRIYATALSTLCLEVYYRFLPLYQMGGRYVDQ